MSFTIDSVNLDCSRQPLLKPFGFKGSSFSEKWLSHVTLCDSDVSVTSTAGLAILWSDAALFQGHTETGGNILSLNVLEWALQKAKNRHYENPTQLIKVLLQPTDEYAKQSTGLANLRETFILNALVGLDNAAWLLEAKQKQANSFDTMFDEAQKVLLSERQSQLAQVPLISYGVSIDEILVLSKQGYFLFKIKLGNGDDPQTMLQNDIHRLKEIHTAIGAMTTPHTEDGRIRYYLDANGRYPQKVLLQQLLDAAKEIHMFDQITVLEEPFPEEAEFDVSDLGVMVAADESLHNAADVAKRAQMGYRSIALKPAGKTLSMTLEMLAQAQRLGLHCFVADSSCTPKMRDWNQNVAARLPRLPGFKTGIMESNGAQNYRNWKTMIEAHPFHQRRWMQPENGIFHLDEEFFAKGF